MDYKKFLSKSEPMVLAYTGGTTVSAKDRRLRMRGEIAPGFWRFDVKGRDAAPIERAEAIGLEDLPRVRGHFASEWIFCSGGEPEHVELLPEEEIAPLSIVVARRWYDGELVYDSTDFDSDAEDEARRALEEGRGIAEAKGIPAPLRAAFGWAMLVRAGRKADVPVSLREAVPFLRELADGGEVAARQVLDAVEALRSPHRVKLENATIDVARTLERLKRQGMEPTNENAQERAEKALEDAGARFLSARNLGDRMEVTFRFRGQRFVCVAHKLTLQILDAGICLVDYEDGHKGDEELTLDSLPSVIGEAIDSGALVITRR